MRWNVTWKIYEVDPISITCKKLINCPYVNIDEMLNTAVTQEYLNITWLFMIYGDILKLLLNTDVMFKSWCNLNNETVTIKVLNMQKVLVW
jgi:hypothetical protein